MNCYYCDRIKGIDPSYATTPASYDLGSAAPRCSRHWRYICGQCGATDHFMRLAYCHAARRFFCSACATATEEVMSPFWAWKYYFNYRSPWSGQWVPSLDRMEFEGTHPWLLNEMRPEAQAAVSQELYLVRYPEDGLQWRPQRQFTDADVQYNWNANADRWNAGYDDDGDRNRRYQSDEPMLALLGDVESSRILDVGCGNGYLCRKLAKAGANVTGIDLSDRFIDIAREREEEEKLGVTYYHGSAANMNFLPDSHFDKAVSNYVLMDIRDYASALGQVFRVLRPGGCFVVVISHPCFASGPAGWVAPAPDSPRREERFAFRVDSYFHRGPYLGQWGGLDPVLSFHRPLRDYWQAFGEAGFTVDAFEEPSITERGRRELPVWRVEQSLRIPYSCIFRLVKPRLRLA
ncbi:MAG: class I SAM-dependent methyltransferase [Chloroflexi bacterium]|nr:class I SAM-dependent methyltransferase [Chloroflexota bacterium]